MRTRTQRRFVALAGALALVGLLPSRAPEAAPGADAAGVVRLERDLQVLRARVELATSSDFYLLLDPEAGRLRLMFGGAILADYPIRGFELGLPQRLFFQSSLPADWCSHPWSGGSLWPVRPPAVAPPEEVDLDTWIPPSPEEAFPLPSRFALRYEGALSVEVLPGTAPATFRERMAAAANRLGEIARLLLGLRTDVLRVRLRMEPQDAASLYRGFPEGSRLLILPPRSSGS